MNKLGIGEIKMFEEEKVEDLKKEFQAIKDHVKNQDTEKVKIAFFGQPGAGKSSLINKIVGKKVVDTGVQTDVTQEAKIIEEEEMILVDLPGYGTSKFPENSYFGKFDPLQYDLFLCIFSGKFHTADTAFFCELKEKQRICFFVRTKEDEIWEDDKPKEELKNTISSDVAKQVGLDKVKVYFTSSKDKTGIKELKDAIWNELEPAKKDKFIRAVKAESMENLEQKKKACQSLITRYACLAATNALNPVPGVDVSVDLGIIMQLFSKLRSTFALNDSTLKEMSIVVPLANNIIKFATKEGILILLKNFATKMTVKEVAKYIPFIGQVVTIVVGYTIVKAAGESYLDDCYKLAKQIFEDEMEKI